MNKEKNSLGVGELSPRPALAWPLCVKCEKPVDPKTQWKCRGVWHPSCFPTDWISPGESYPTVIGRGFDEEPVVLTAFRVDGATGYVYVGKPWARHPIGLPLADVFAYDDWTFTKLKRAYDKGNKTVLRLLYKEAQRFQ